MNCVYIGEEFYSQSNSVMSSVYEEVGNQFTRTDWGFIRIALEQGKEVHVRQATKQEKEFFLKRLDGYLTI